MQRGLPTYRGQCFDLKLQSYSTCATQCADLCIFVNGLSDDRIVAISIVSLEVAFL